MSLSKGIQSAAAAALSAAMLIAVAACGTTDSTDTASKSGDSSKDSSSTSIQGFDTSSIQKDDEIAALLPDSVAGDGTLTVGTSAEYAPFEYKDDNGDYQGFDLELIKAIGDKLGLDVEYVNNDFDTLVPGVASGAKYDVAIAAITDTLEREKEVTFSDSYYMDDQAIVTKVDNTDITADNYSEKLNNADATIIVQSGSTAEAFAQENFPKAKIVPYKDATECFSALQSDKGDAVVTNRSVASQLTAEQFNTCQTIKQISTGEEYAIAINQGNTKLKDDINQAIKDLTDDGTVDALMAKYNIK